MHASVPAGQEETIIVQPINCHVQCSAGAGMYTDMHLHLHPGIYSHLHLKRKRSGCIMDGQRTIDELECLTRAVWTESVCVCTMWLELGINNQFLIYTMI